MNRMAGGLGFEPRQAESESAVLPLDDPPTDRGAPGGTARLDQPPTPCKDVFSSDSGGLQPVPIFFPGVLPSAGALPWNEAKLHGNRGKPDNREGGSQAPAAPLLAVLDLGTNNCRLLIAAPAAKGGFRVVDSFSRIVRLGEGVGQTGRLSDAALDRTIAALRICSERIAKHKVKHVRVIATQAARLASNADVLVARARDEAGLALEVISADEEADLAAAGCAPLIGRKYKGALVFDIGGGSTEIIWLAKSPPDPANGGPQKKLAASVPLGVVSLAESYGAAATSREGFERMREDLRARFEPYAKQMEGFDIRKNHLLGTSGTVTTLAAIALKLPRYNRSRVDGSWHETRHMLNVVDRLAGMDTATLAEIGSIGTERADLMLPGCAIFAAICALWPSPVLRVADRGLREGMLRQLSQELS
jgi:exopolyphosphatase/guanosine-5'-triphosphate,3'-diphosphate pyrophosphatase